MVTAYLFATTKIGKEKEVLEEISKISNIKEVHTVYGDYDIVVKIEASTINDLNKVILTGIRNISEIVSTSTLINM